MIPRSAEPRRMNDRRMLNVEDRLSRLEARINALFGALGVIVVLANVGLAAAVALMVR